MILYRINFEDDKACIQEVELLVRVQQVVVFATFVVRLQHVEKIGQVKILFPDLFLTEQCRVVGGEILVKAVERRNDTVVRLDTLDKERHGIGEGNFLRTGGRLVVLLPEGQQQGFDALPLLHIIHLVGGIEGIEADGTLIRIDEIDPVLALCLVAYHLAQALIAVSRVHQDDMGVLLPVLPQEVVGEERLATARRTQDEFVSVRGDAFLHRQVGDVEMNGLAAAVSHLDAER